MRETGLGIRADMLSRIFELFTQVDRSLGRAHAASSYLTDKRVCDLSESCALQSLTPDVQRSDAHIKAAFEAKMIDVVTTIADGLTEIPADQRLDRAWALLAVFSGGITHGSGGQWEWQVPLSLSRTFALYQQPWTLLAKYY